MLRTPFHQFHLDRGAKMVEFAGWEMPISYGSIIDEHKQVRCGGGLFDVSHMGRLKISGRHARKFIERVVTRRVTDMPENTCRYALVCNERGGVMDDILVYRFDDHWLLVVNASNRFKIIDHLQRNVGDLVVKVEDQTESTAMVAVQGPRVMEMIGQFSREVPTLKRYGFCVKNLLILKLIISRTGYTGEDGVEVMMGAGMANMALKLLVKESDGGDEKKVSVKPTGLGARDTLRLEAGMPLYGHELSEEIDPISAGLAWAVNLDKDQQENGEPFIGQEPLRQIAAAGPMKKLVGLKLEGRRTARQHMAVTAAGAGGAADKQVGEVTSGCLSPTLGYSIAMAYVSTAYSATGTRLALNIGSQKVGAEVVALPFYKRAR